MNIKDNQQHIRKSIRDTYYPYDCMYDTTYFYDNLDTYLIDKEELYKYKEALEVSKEEIKLYKQKLSDRLKIIFTIFVIITVLSYIYTIGHLLELEKFYFLIIYLVGPLFILFIYLYDFIDKYASFKSNKKYRIQNSFVEHYYSEQKWKEFIWLHLKDIPKEKRQELYDSIKDRYHIDKHTYKNPETQKIIYDKNKKFIEKMNQLGIVPS